MEERERSEGKKKSQETKSTESPAADTESRTDRTSGESDADKLDVCSDHFDPLAALYSPTVSVPFPNVKCFNNVAAYESFLKGGRGRAKPENVEKRRLKAMRGVADPERIERLKKLMVNKAESEEGESSRAPRGRRHKPQKNVLTRMPCRSTRATTISRTAVLVLLECFLIKCTLMFCNTAILTTDILITTVHQVL